MTSLLTLVAALSTTAMPAGSDALCEVALADARRFAQAQGWQIEARCRMPRGRPLPPDASLQAGPWPSLPSLSSGALTWPVRVQVGAAGPFVQRVPLTVGWIAPAWVSTRDLAIGAALKPGDVELRSLRWPDGLLLRSADPLSIPDGRLRRALRRGEIVTATSLLPADALVRGDRVTAVLAQGAMEMRLPAALLAPAQVGQRARVQAAGRQLPLEGRLLDPQTLQVDTE